MQEVVVALLLLDAYYWHAAKMGTVFSKQHQFITVITTKGFHKNKTLQFQIVLKVDLVGLQADEARYYLLWQLSRLCGCRLTAP